MKIITWLIVAFNVVSVPVAVASPDNGAGAPTIVPGDNAFSLTYGGSIRHYLVHIPPAAETSKPLPVVLSFHGERSNAKHHRAYAGMDNLSDQKGFIVVYPQGSGRWGHRGLTWNAGKCCGYAVKKNIDDVGFVRALINDLATKAAIDRDRVYATGFSNGAMMTYRLAVEAREIIAAIAPVAGAMAVEAFTPTRPVPIMHIHSVDDPRAHYDGGFGPRTGLFFSRIKHESVVTTIEEWAKFNQCFVEPARERSVRGGLGAVYAGHGATLYAYRRCDGGNEVALWKLQGVGHIWPGGNADFEEVDVGPSTKIIDANSEIWRFFSRFSLSTKRDVSSN